MNEGQYIDLNLYGTDKSDSMITNPLHLFFQEIELSVKVAPGELWGVRDNVDLNRYLFNQYITVDQIQREILNYISKHCIHAKFFQYDIEAKILNIENKDLIYIVIKIYDENEDKEFIQKFMIGE